MLVSKFVFSRFKLTKTLRNFTGKRFLSNITTGDGNNHNLLWPIQYTYMMTCQELWPNRPTGAAFYVGCVDTGPPKDKANAKNVVFLLNEHTVDDENVLKQLQNNIFKPLVMKNCRILMPCLVGSRYTKGVTPEDDICFDYQLLGERSRFLLDFIVNRKMSKVDLIIGHSMACFSALTLSANCELFKKLALISPIPGHKAPKWIKPIKRSLLGIDSYRHLLLWPLGRILLRGSGKKMEGLLNGECTNEQVLHLAKVSHGINYNMVSNIVTSFTFRKVPFLAITSHNDEVVDGADNDEYLDMFGVSKHNTVLRETSSSPSSPSPSRSLSRGVQLQCSTHYPFLEDDTSKIIVDEILNFLNISN